MKICLESTVIFQEHLIELEGIFHYVEQSLEANTFR